MTEVPTRASPGPDPAALLAWYDRHGRDLPWRIGPAARRDGRRPDPYRVWLSEVMLQQTTVAAVTPYFRRFLEAWPDVTALAAAEEGAVMAAWAGLGYYARARNLVACARAVAARPGAAFPDTEAELRALPGIGPYTAAAVAAIAFDRPAAVVDGNVERVMARLFAVETPLPAAKPDLRRHAATLTPRERSGDYAQAVMDLGATICTPRRPACALCPWSDACRARASGLQGDLPRRAAKPVKPLRLGIVYLGRREDGAWLLERRPARGLLGGMLGWPGGPWLEAAPDDPALHAPPAEAAWRDPGVTVEHVFTHFRLRLGLRIAHLPLDAPAGRGAFHDAARFDPAALPTLMRKAFVAAAPHLEPRAETAGHGLPGRRREVAT